MNGNVKAAGIVAPPRMMLATASFSIAAGQDTGSASFEAGDGVMEARTGATANSVDDTLGGITDFSELLQYEGIAKNLNVSGAFFSAQARWTTLSVGTFVELFAVCRGSSSVDFYVNGDLKYSLSVTMPTTAASTYEIQVTNGASGGEAALQVGYLTVGFPM